MEITCAIVCLPRIYDISSNTIYIDFIAFVNLYILVFDTNRISVVKLIVLKWNKKQKKFIDPDGANFEKKKYLFLSGLDTLFICLVGLFTFLFSTISCINNNNRIKHYICWNSERMKIATRKKQQFTNTHLLIAPVMTIISFCCYLPYTLKKIKREKRSKTNKQRSVLAIEHGLHLVFCVKITTIIENTFTQMKAQSANKIIKVQYKPHSILSLK